MTRNHVLVILLQSNKRKVFFFSYRKCYGYSAVEKREEVDNTGINLIYISLIIFSVSIEVR